ncbi:MAG TPA: outer membrane beta-barrel protein [Opitutaceae bacterium]
MLNMRLARLKKWPRIPCLLLLAVTGAAMAPAAIWEDPSWALTAKADATVGYDSNISAVDGGPSDSFASFKPSLVATRKDATLSFDTEAWADFTAFQRDTGTDSIDPGIRMTLSYPANVDTLPTQAAEAHWIRTTSANLDVGGRVSQDDALVKYEGDLVDTGKTTIVGRASVEQDDYLGAAYSNLRTASVGTTLSYSPQPLIRAGAGYDLTLGRSEANSAGAGDLDQTEQAFTFQASGEFTPKISGKISVGSAYSDYTGTFIHSEWDAIAGAHLTWKPVERLSLEVQVLRAPYFSAGGNVDLSTSVGLGIRKELSNGFAVTANGQAGNTDHKRTVTYRSDAIEGAGAGLDYNLTGRITASVNYGWTKQDSDVARYTYTRDVVTAAVLCRF